MLNFKESSLVFVGESRFSDLIAKGVTSGIKRQLDADGLFSSVTVVTRYAVTAAEATEARREQINLRAFPNHGRNPFKVLRSFRGLRDLMLDVKPDVIRSGMPYSASLLACLVGRFSNIPVVVSIGGDHRLSNSMSGVQPLRFKWLSNIVESIVYAMADVVLAPNTFAAEYVRHCALPFTHPQVATVPWVIGEDLASADETGHSNDKEVKLVAKETDPNVLIVGHLNAYKLSHVMFAMIQIVRRRGCENIHFIFCGDGPLRDMGQSMFESDERVHFLGWQSQGEVRAMIQASTVVLIPMSGFVMLEAAAAGRAVIAADMEWHGEIVSPGYTGILVTNYESAEAWAQELLTLISDSKKRSDMGKRLRLTFQDRYSPEVCRKAQREMYECLLISSTDHARRGFRRKFRYSAVQGWPST